MSRIGKKPVALLDGVTVTIDGQTVKAKGPKGELSVDLVDLVTVKQTDEGVQVDPVNDSKEARSAWGMSRTLVNNIVTGVKEGFSKKLTINGVGFRAQMQGNDLKLALGFSHDVIVKAPEGIKFEAPQPTEVIVSGIDKQAVGQVAANIREFRPPEPYKGKGIRYEDEYIFRKEGKKK
ncbi:50S ribosomal protein L6 [Maritalea mediterranea]|uniref:Large ribosomal subunit protein uL6 n=1 Tax=Maritalea mediterranea TaxID=2909667 RepID=A0ABS9E710_9HYPH|nr:50S ribosomal protein L6 [Maritalea mediterranea]MCF4098666.1 50S ribosomal protein L6 [Maritalea mediterranea]